MFYIVESDNQLNWLKNQTNSSIYLDIITSNDNFHPKLSSLVAVYIRPIECDQGYIIPIDHEEGLNVGKERVYDILNKFSTIYTLNKKRLLYHFNLEGVFDLSLLHSMNSYERFDTPNNISTINWYYSKYYSKYDINKIIPISKLYERCESVFEYLFLNNKFDFNIPSGFEFYNTVVTKVFFLIEQQGLSIDQENLIEVYKVNTPALNISNNKIYTEYNLYNVTSRPTNAFNSINFSAMPKDSVHRTVFKPENDYFVQFDFDGYHVRLLCEQIGYDLTEESAHEQLARLYFNKETLTDEEYIEAKGINFHALYGKIPEEHKELPIFKLIQNYIRNMWQTYENQGAIYNPISGKPFTNKLQDMHPAKLMNYTMQSLETSRNVLILKEALKYLSGKKSKIVLYVYDAIIIDFNKEDGKETLEELKEILENSKRYPVKFNFSTDLLL